MDVILLEDVKKLGKKGETISVSDGYATNFLIPRKLAVKKTEGSLKILNKQQEDERIRQETLKEEALKTKEKLESIVVVFKAKTTGNGTMAGTISTKEVENKLKDEFKILIDKRKIIDKYPINAFGYTNLKIELYKGIIGNIKIHVEEDK